jgi:hypothetical protein
MSIKTLKWVSTASAMIGIALTSYDIFPLNTFFNCGAAAGWCTAGILTKDKPQWVGSGIAVLFYVSGWIHLLLR